MLYIHYKDGSSRIINVRPEFFAIRTAKNETKKEIESELIKKCIDISVDTGVVYKIQLLQEGKEIFQKTFEKNCPAVKIPVLKVSEAVKAFEHLRLKNFKKETKGVKLKVYAHFST